MVEAKAPRLGVALRLPVGGDVLLRVALQLVRPEAAVRLSARRHVRLVEVKDGAIARVERPAGHRLVLSRRIHALQRDMIFSYA